MVNIYECYIKLIEGKKHYFVKRFLHLTDCENVIDILDGYGMHTEFKKACIIAGIKEADIQQQIFDSMNISSVEAKVICMNNPIAVVKSITG
jgi:hypothetical protein